MDYIFAWVFLAIVVIIIGAVLYDNMKCKHEWEQQTFEKGGAKYYYLTCKKCGKVKVLK